MPRRWQFQSHDAGRVDSLARELRCSTLLAQVLISRGLTDAEQTKTFLSNNLNHLQEPEILPGVVAATELITTAISQNRLITIYGDYDVDGMTSVSILLQCLRSLGARADYYIPCRMDEGYGLNCEAIRELHQADPDRLVITVDCGISSLAEVDLAQKIGLEIIITDHHQFGSSLPNAAAVVHPRIEPDSPAFPDPCGAGVAFKLAWSLCKTKGESGRATERMREFLKTAVGLAMIGTIADVVPLVGENRLIVKYGLETLLKQAGPGVQALLKLASSQDKRTLSAEDIGFGVAPRLNAAGRLGQARLAVELLITQDAERATQLAEYLDGLNKQRQSVERKIQKQARECVAEHPDWADDPVLVISHHEWHPGVIGIVASRIAEQFEKPTVLITEATNGDLAQGSGRSHAGFNLHQAVTACQEHLDKQGGHPAAIGLKIEPANISAFRTALNQQATLQMAQQTERPARAIDSEVAFNELTLQAIEELEHLGPFGCQNERPLFAATGVELAEPPKTMGEGGRHLSLRVKQYGQTLRAVAFGRGEWAAEIEKINGPLALCFKPNINEFRGRKSVEMQLIDWKPNAELLS